MTRLQKGYCSISWIDDVSNEVTDSYFLDALIKQSTHVNKRQQSQRSQCSQCSQHSQHSQRSQQSKEKVNTVNAVNTDNTDIISRKNLLFIVASDGGRWSLHPVSSQWAISHQFLFEIISYVKFVNTVNTVNIVNTVNTIYTVNTAYTAYTVNTFFLTTSLSQLPNIISAV